MRKLFFVQKLVIDDRGGIVSIDQKTIDRPYHPGPPPTLRRKSDAYEASTLIWLLQQVGVTDCDCFLRDYSAERILQVACHVIKQRMAGKVRDAKAYTISAFRNRWPLNDCRAEILPLVCNFQLPPKISKTPENDDRREAQKLLAKYLESRGTK